MKQFHFLCAIIFTMSISAHAQHELPSWVGMIDKTDINYYEAVNSFETYWKGKIKPIEEMDIEEIQEMSQKEKDERQAYFSRMSTAEKNEFDLLQYHYKRFKQWKKDVLPFVQEDGRILTLAERLSIWQQQQNEINQHK